MPRSCCNRTSTRRKPPTRSSRRLPRPTSTARPPSSPAGARCVGWPTQEPGRRGAVSAGRAPVLDRSAALARHLLALLARLRKPDGDGLLAAFPPAASAAASAPRGSALVAPHLAFNVALRAARVSSLPPFLRHSILLGYLANRMQELRPSSSGCPRPHGLNGSARMAPMPGKRVQFDDETWQALDELAHDRMQTFQELAEEAFADVLKKHGRPVGLKAALRESAGRSATVHRLPAKKR